MRKKSLFKTVFAYVCVVFIGATLSITMSHGVVRADEVIKWKMSTFDPKEGIPSIILRWWIDQVQYRSSGRIKITLYYQGQLCSAKEMIDSVASGYADVVTAVPVYTPGRTPLASMVYVPFATTERCDTTNFLIHKMADHPLWVKENDKNNAVFAFWSNGDPYNIMSKVPIRTIDDFKGIKIRGAGDQTTLFKALGAIPVSCTAPEAYTAIERGLVDAAAGVGDFWFWNWGLVDAFKNGYYIKGLDFNHAGFEILINKDSYKALPPDIKTIIERIKWEMPIVTHDIQLGPELVERFLDMYKAAGIEISRFPKQERDKMISDHAQAIWNSWKERNKDFGGYEFFDAWIEERDKTLERFPHGIYTERPLSLAVRKHLPKIQ